MEKQKLLYQQARLHDRGAAEMVLQTISASKGTIPLSHCVRVSTLPYTVALWLLRRIPIFSPTHPNPIYTNKYELDLMVRYLLGSGLR